MTIDACTKIDGIEHCLLAGRSEHQPHIPTRLMHMDARHAIRKRLGTRDITLPIPARLAYILIREIQTGGIHCSFTALFVPTFTRERCFLALTHARK